MGAQVVEWLERMPHTQWTPHPGFESRPGILCCMSVPLSFPLFPVIELSNKGVCAEKILKKNKKLNTYFPIRKGLNTGFVLKFVM